jgi:hypothetical protein
MIPDPAPPLEPANPIVRRPNWARRHPDPDPRSTNRSWTGPNWIELDKNRPVGGGGIDEGGERENLSEPRGFLLPFRRKIGGYLYAGEGEKACARTSRNRKRRNGNGMEAWTKFGTREWGRSEWE